VYADLWDIPYRTIPLNDDFSINTADYTTSCGGACGGVALPNPNAPTGMPVSLGDILSLAECLDRHKKVFILDEAYIGFGSAGNGESAIPHIGNHPNLLCVHTLSKSSSLAGLRAGFAIGNEALIEGLRRMRDSFNSYTLDRLALAGVSAAVSDTAYYDAINRRVIATRERVSETLRGFGCTVLPSAANFIFMKAQGIAGTELFTELRRRGILVRHFNRERIADFLRVSIGTDEEMDVFLAACKETIGI
jgi:histidinol-phosphate aminotransferase